MVIHDPQQNNVMELPSPETDPLWTVEEVARYFRLKPSTVRNMAKRGELPAVKIGRVWRFRRSALKKIFVMEEQDSKKLVSV